MEFIQQPFSLPVSNIEANFVSNTTAGGKKIQLQKNGPLLPRSVRALVCGPSSCGKTNIVLSLIQHINGLKFEAVYIYSKSLDQNKYKYLEEMLKPIAGMHFETFSRNENVISPTDAHENSLIIFDDISTDPQGCIADFFSRGRHRGIDCFYLTQTYARLPKHLIRDNANVVVLFKQDELNLKHVFKDCSISCDMSFKQFHDICVRCWQERYGCIVIVLDCEKNEGRYRRGFDTFIQL